MKKVCKNCNAEKELSEFYTNGKTPKGTIKYKPTCKPCDLARQKLIKQQNINSALEELGLELKCELCGYKKNRAALCFHHLDEEEKDFSFGHAGNLSLARFKAEIEKCVILCHNCHMEEHYPGLNI